MANGNDNTNLLNFMPTGQTNTLQDLAMMLLMNRARRQPDTGPQMITAGGRVLGTLNPRTSGWDVAGQNLENLAGNYLMMSQMQKKRQFFQSINNIMGANDTQESKKNKLQNLILQHGTDYGLGISEPLMKNIAQTGMPIYRMDASGNIVPVGTVQKGAKVISQGQRNIADVSDLTAEQQLQGRALARKIYGVRGAEYGLPAVYEEMRKGKTIDEIEDTLRYAGQSKEFAGPVRNAAQTLLMNVDANKAQTTMDYIDDLVSKGDTEGVKQQLKRVARLQAGTDEQRTVMGKERTIKLLDEIQGDLNTLEANGINTNIFTGTAEQIAAKAGAVINPEMRKIATKISVAVQNYRRSMTGVQFGMPENREYQIMFPKITRTANFNTANINALREAMQGDLDNFYSLSMGEDNYKSLFGEGMRGQVNLQRNLMSQGTTTKTQKIGRFIMEIE